MSDKKKLWDQQRGEREAIRKEFLQKLQTLREEIQRKEFEIDSESQRQIDSELKFSKLNFQHKLKEELELFKSKEREIEDKCRTQELIEKSRLREDFETRINRLYNDEDVKCSDIEVKTRLKARHQLTDLRVNYRRELDSAIDAMNKQIMELEEKLTGRERDLLDTTPSPTTQTTSTSKASEKQSPKDKQKLTLKEPDTITSEDEVQRPTDLRTLDKKKDGKDGKEGKDGKGQKVDAKKNQKKDDKKKIDPKKDPTKPWTNMNKFNG